MLWVCGIRIGNIYELLVAEFFPAVSRFHTERQILSMTGAGIERRWIVWHH